MQKRSFIKAALTLVLGLVIGTASADEHVLRIGYQKYGTSTLLKARGTLETRLKAQGWSVKWTEFPAGPQLLEGLNVGSIDFGTTGEAPPIFAQAAGANLLYVGYEPAAAAAEGILVPADSPIKTLADLRGKKIVFNKGSNAHYLVVKALEKAGIAYSDVTTVHLPPADARAAFERGSVDAWAIWDPYLASAEKQLKVRQLTDGKGLVANHQFFLASKDFAKTSPQVLRVVLEELDKTDKWASQNQQEVTRLIAPLIGLPEDVVRVSVNRQSYGVKPLDESTIAAQQRIADAFFKLGLVPQKLEVKDIVWH